MTDTRQDEPSPDLSDADARIVVDAVDIERSDVDQDAERVLSRLQRNGYEAYLVGGCVRDLYLGRKPKDYDLATEAHPRQIKRLFRNGRIIGRRFRLVHVVYGDHIVETATFRREPDRDEEPGGDLLIREDNEYGTARQDALRRDFTVNGLFYDPFKSQIIDYVGGLADLESGILRTIGDPRVRMAEDPVRVLRAVKFATRLGFHIEDATWQAMIEMASELVRSAPPRVLEEILRLLRSGTALGAFQKMRKCGALAAILPEVDDHLGRRDDPEALERADAYWRLLEALDADVHAGQQPRTSVALAVVFLGVIEQRALRAARSAGREQPDHNDLADQASRTIEPIARAARLSRRALERAKRIIVDQRRFDQPGAKGARQTLFMRSDEFLEALDLYRLRCSARGQGWDVYEGWVERSRKAREMPDTEVEGLRSRRKRRRGRRGRRRPGAGPVSTDD